MALIEVNCYPSYQRHNLKGNKEANALIYQLLDRYAFIATIKAKLKKIKVNVI
jgi:hypothetical protein